MNESKIVKIEWPEMIGNDLLTFDCISLIHYFRVPLCVQYCSSNLKLYIKIAASCTKHIQLAQIIEGPENCL